MLVSVNFCDRNGYISSRFLKYKNQHGVCGPAGERDKIPLPPKVPSGSHQCYSYLCFWHIFTSQFIFLLFIFYFCYFPLLPPSFYSLLFTRYPLHFMGLFYYLFYVKYNFYLFILKYIILFILKYIIFIHFEIYYFYLF